MSAAEFDYCNCNRDRRRQAGDDRSDQAPLNPPRSRPVVLVFHEDVPEDPIAALFGFPARP